jgi:hypothetical protein
MNSAREWKTSRIRSRIRNFKSDVDDALFSRGMVCNFPAGLYFGSSLSMLALYGKGGWCHALKTDRITSIKDCDPSLDEIGT